MGLQGTDHLTEFAEDKRIVRLQYVAFAFLLLGMKLWLIWAYGNATPYWDQWDAEGAGLYKPFNDGTLGLSDMLSPHNEHRIFTTRVLALALLILNKNWNPLLQMVVNACLHIAAIMFVISLLVRVIGRNYLPALFGFSLLLFSIPYAWENTLAGFQSQFYFVFLFGIASLWLTVTHGPLSKKWWWGIVCAVFAFLSLASGIFALAASAVINGIFYFAGLRKTRKQLICIIVLIALTAVEFFLTPTLPYHEPLKAASFTQFYHALAGTLGWPISSNLIAVLARNLPALILTVILIRKRPPLADSRWFLLALIVWSVGQSVSIADGRAVGNLSSRYLDLFAIGILVNFACFISLVQSNPPKRAKWLAAGVSIWVALIFISLGSFAKNYVWKDLDFKHSCSLQEEMNTRNYLATGDFGYLKDKPFLYIPYPDPQRLAQFLNWPEIRKILPDNIRPPLSPVSIESKPVDAFIGNGYFYTTPKRTDTTLGSHNAQGDKGTGQLLMKFEAVNRGEIELPVAGYPLGAGMKIEIEQNGKSSRVIIESDPKESWGIGRAKVERGAFTVRVTDSSLKYWAAVSIPTLKGGGKFDRLTEKLLSKHYLFILVGLALIICSITYNGWITDAARSTKQDE